MTRSGAKNSYGLAILTLAAGAVLMTAYAFAAVYIPLLIFGALIPLGVALLLNLLLMAGLRGSRGFRGSMVGMAIATNLAALWFASFWAHWGWDEAVYSFSRGPEFVLDSIIYLSDTLSFQVGEAKDVLRNSGITITGAWLQLLWALEAAVIAASVVYGFILSDQRQHLPAGAGMGADAATQMKQGAPVLRDLVIGTAKGLAQVALVFGVVYLILEVL